MIIAFPHLNLRSSCQWRLLNSSVHPACFVTGVQMLVAGDRTTGFCVEEAPMMEWWHQLLQQIHCYTTSWIDHPCSSSFLLLAGASTTNNGKSHVTVVKEPLTLSTTDCKGAILCGMLTWLTCSRLFDCYSQSDSMAGARILACRLDDQLQERQYNQEWLLHSDHLHTKEKMMSCMLYKYLPVS